jgi:hypothetical protein
VYEHCKRKCILCLMGRKAFGVELGGANLSCNVGCMARCVIIEEVERRALYGGVELCERQNLEETL